MVLHTAKGTKAYKIKDLDFTNVMCDLEDRGIDIMGMMNDGGLKDGKVFTTLRVITAAMIGEDDLKKAGRILSEHLKNGGEMDEIFNAFVEVMESAGFGGAAEEEQNETAVQEEMNLEA